MSAKHPTPPAESGAFALFDNNLDTAGQAGAWCLTGLVEEVVCHDPADWAACLRQLENAAYAGAWVALAEDRHALHQQVGRRREHRAGEARGGGERAPVARAAGELVVARALEHQRGVVERRRRVTRRVGRDRAAHRDLQEPRHRAEVPPARADRDDPGGRDERAGEREPEGRERGLLPGERHARLTTFRRRRPVRATPPAR